MTADQMNIESQKALGRDDELKPYLNPATTRFLSRVLKAILQDPGLPRQNPTVSAWQVPPHPSLASIQSGVLPEITDYAVIGSGITGCSVTKTLLEHPATADSHITVLEARTLVSGATGRNGGHLVTASGHTFGPLAEQHGIEAAREITRFSLMNIEHLMKLVGALDPALQEECQIRDVLKVMAVGDEETWASAKNSVLSFQDNVPEHSNYHRIIERDQVPEQNALTERIWIGNETAYMKDILTPDDTYVPDEAKQALSTVLPKLFWHGWGLETVSEIESIWSGIQGHTADGLPVVGKIPESLTGTADDDGQWIAAGFNGYGMDKCWLTGEALVKMMLGEDVSEWFPQAFLVTEERLQTKLTAERTLLKFAMISLPGGVKEGKL
ncbi:FAD dependent oxidoreductase superfamily [Fusarium beomiforme]|uniref:FAD dependent oxidoreductase superfamily n=1 Tax=Fusarium beomiforme TaxID=44412 RepID=A0A9P5A9Q0_9HYPO|nr:FAD dependent oxidoreductase superfamily [Fusarium beomiforme]